ncbi:RNA polymerase sigma factor [Ramlibacter henchirensis]|uniref:RNA polymerase sigma factor n=1 Tax=Ramlibacter henchirensis TaxID=204072 RepID=A0A4Z0C630_9BURK|nr:RNA polymerase sigma factor [Ramlibacter henchirensis]TFZ05559.1 RNA polymerase sigma factor [Ramlibacter henchirensis]
MNEQIRHLPAPEAAPPHVRDEQLLSDLRSGRADAFAQLMRRYNRMLFRAARGIVADDAEAQDAVQEGYLRAFLALDSYRGESSLRTWLTRIVINQALGQQRRLGRVVFLDETFPEDEEGAMSEQTPGRLGGIDPSTPEDAASNSELRRQLEAAIDLLPPIYRCVFILRAVEGLSVEDTASSLRVSADVVKTRYLRARGMLRLQLDTGAAEPLSNLHDFRGARCDEMVRQVLAKLRACGVVRDQ